MTSTTVRPHVTAPPADGSPRVSVRPQPDRPRRPRLPRRRVLPRRRGHPLPPGYGHRAGRRRSVERRTGGDAGRTGPGCSCTGPSTRTGSTARWCCTGTTSVPVTTCSRATHRRLLEGGYAFAGVTTQRVGVHGLPSAPQGLHAWDPARLRLAVDRQRRRLVRHLHPGRSRRRPRPRPHDRSARRARRRGG